MNKLTTMVCAILAATFMLEFATAQDCGSVEDSVERAPAWYIEQCMDGAVDGHQRGTMVSTAYALNMLSDEILAHPQNDFSAATPTGGTNGMDLYAMESSPDGTEIWAIDDATNDFGVLDPVSGTLDVIGTATPLAGHTWTGLTANARGTWALSTDGASSALYSLDPSTGSVTEIGSQTTAPLLIDLAVTCEGDMFSHDIGDNSLYSVDVSTGAVTLIGSIGFDANFAQGMSVDRNTGEIYGYLFNVIVHDTRYGTFDTTSGAFQVINAVAAPPEEAEGATTSACDVLPDSRSVPTMRAAGLTVLGLILLLVGGLVVRGHAMS